MSDTRGIKSSRSSIPDPLPLEAVRTSSFGEPTDIGYLYSCPLVYKKPFGEITPLPLLNVEEEKRSFRAVFDEAQRDISVRYDVARVERLTTLVMRQCRALHYSGHGMLMGLAFEGKAGELHVLEPSILRQLVEAASEDSLKLVFVSACYSEEAGQAFINSGVPHVVAVRWDVPINDQAALTFSSHFYMSLLSGKSILASFQIGKAIVNANPDIIHQDESDKFLLLPEDVPDEYHNVSLFDHTNVGAWRDLSPKIYDTNLPSVPEKFHGRQIECQTVISYLAKDKHRLIILVGEDGIGKTAISKFVGKYLYIRRDFKGVFFIRLGKLIDEYNHEDKLSFGHLISLELSGFLFDSPCLNDKEFFSCLRELPQHNLLFILDGVDKAMDLRLSEFLTDLFFEVTLLQVLLTCRIPIADVDDVLNVVYNVPKLNDYEVALLLHRVCGSLIIQDDLPEGSGSHMVRLSEHDAVKAMQGNPGRACFASHLLHNARRLGDIIPDITSWHLVQEEEKASLSTLTKSVSIELELQFSSSKISNSGKKVWKRYFPEKSSLLLKEFRHGIVDLFDFTTGVSRGLTEKELQFIEQTFNLKQNINIDMFAKFWLWFEPFMNIIKRCSDVWDHDQKCMFVISTSQCVERITNKPVGTCLLRMSSRMNGNLVLAYVSSSGNVLQHLIDCNYGNEFRMMVGNKEYVSFNRIQDLLVNFTPVNSFVDGSVIQKVFSDTDNVSDGPD